MLVMKKYVLFLMVLLLMVIGCNEEDEKREIKGVVIQAEGETTIYADGEQEVQLLVVIKDQDDKDWSEKSKEVKYYVKNENGEVELENNIFKTKISGKHTLIAKIEGISSNSIEVMAIHPNYDLIDVQKVKKWLTFEIIKGENESLDQITSMINLVKTDDFELETIITWEAEITDGDGMLNVDTGKIIQGLNDTPINLKATIKKGNEIEEFTLGIIILKLDANKIKDNVEDEIQKLTFDKIKKDNISEFAILGDLDLIKEGENGTIIQWSVSEIKNGATLNVETGQVGLGNIDTEIVLTAKVTKGDYSKEKIFNLLIKVDENILNEEIDEAIAELTFDKIKKSNISENYITNNLKLPKEFIKGTSIEWDVTGLAKNASIDLITGDVTLGNGDVEVVLIAKIKKFDLSKEKKFELTIRQFRSELKEKLDEISSKIYFGDIKGENVIENSVTESLNLIKDGHLKSRITWSAEGLKDRAEIDFETGDIIQGLKDVNVKLIANIVFSNYAIEKYFDIVIKRANETLKGDLLSAKEDLTIEKLIEGEIKESIDVDLILQDTSINGVKIVYEKDGLENGADLDLITGEVIRGFADSKLILKAILEKDGYVISKEFNFTIKGIKINITGIDKPLSVVGEEVKLIAVIDDEKIDQKVMWSVDNGDVVSVDDNGVVKAIKSGEAVITATSKADEKISSMIKVFVNIAPISVDIKDTKLMFTKLNEQKEIEFSILPLEAYQNVSFESLNPEVVKVDNQGIVTAISSGKGKILVKSTENSELSKEVEIDIDIDVEGIEIKEKVLIFDKLDSEKVINVMLIPNQVFQNITYEIIDSEIVSISGKGVVKALKAGETKIIVSSEKNNTVKDEVVIKVYPKVEKLNLSSEKLVFKEKDEKQAISVEILPETSFQKSMFISENEMIAIVDSMTGEVTSITSGKTNILVYPVGYENMTKKVEIEVIIKPEELSIDKQRIVFNKINQEEKIVISILPEYSNKEYSIISTNEDVAMVDSDGKVIPIGNGNAKVLIKSSSNEELSAECLVEVLFDIDEIKISKQEITMNEEGGEEKLQAMIYPEKAYQTVLWQSDNDNVATVNEEGVVKAISSGTATITATSTSDNSKQASCIVNVIFKPVVNVEIMSKTSKVANIKGLAKDNSEIVSLVFDFGDGTTLDYIDDLSAIDINHNYENEGKYDIKITAKDDEGLVTELIKSVEIKENFYPVVEIIDIKTELMDVSITVKASDVDGDDLSAVIQWGDGEFEKTANISEDTFTYSYTISDVYEVKINVTDSFGNSVIEKVKVDTNMKPEITMLSAVGLSNSKEVELKLNTSDIDGMVSKVKVYWTETDIDEITSKLDELIIKHIYDKKEVRIIKVVAVDNEGAETTEMVTVKGQPDIEVVEMNQMFMNQTIKLIISDIEKENVSLLINWGDENEKEINKVQLESEIELSHTYLIEGEYLVKIEVVDESGLKSSYEYSIKTNKKPILDLELTEISKNGLLITGLIEDPDGSIAKVEIDYGEGEYEELELKMNTINITKFYNNSGEYKVKLRVIDNANGIVEKEYIVNINNNVGPNIEMEITNIDLDKKTIKIFYNITDLEDDEIASSEIMIDNKKLELENVITSIYEYETINSVESIKSISIISKDNKGNERIKTLDEDYIDAKVKYAIFLKEFAVVEKGTFTMGDIKGTGEEDEIPEHEVTLTYDFYIKKYEVTQKDYVVVMKKNPSYFEGIYKPVETVSWWSAINYCNQLSVIEGRPKAYDELTGELIDKNGNKTTDISEVKGYRLPTEAEWEFAARGGNSSKMFEYSGSNNVDDVAWYEMNNTNYGTKVVGTKKDNELGIYDMSGNVWEWTYDSYSKDSYTQEAETNPVKFDVETTKVIRGGYWDNYDRYVRISNRAGINSDNASSDIGFGVVLTK